MDISKYRLQKYNFFRSIVHFFLKYFLVVSKFFYNFALAFKAVKDGGIAQLVRASDS